MGTTQEITVSNAILAKATEVLPYTRYHEDYKEFIPSFDGEYKTTLNLSNGDVLCVSNIVSNAYYETYTGNTEVTSRKKLVCFGDSITGAFTDALRNYPYLISQKTNLEVFNVGFGGARMGQHPTLRYDAFSMYRIVDEIIKPNTDSTKWALQDADTTGHETYPTRLATLKGIDFNTVDYITIAYGTNDWGGGHTPNLPVDNPEDPFDVTNYYGATRYALKTIQEAYPHLKIILVSPYYRYDTASEQDADDGWRPTYNPNHHLIEYVDALTEVGDEFKTPSLDMWRELGINKYNRVHYFDEPDGTHPNNNGMDLIASRVAGQLKALYAVS